MAARKSGAVNALDGGVSVKAGAAQGSRVIMRYGYIRGINGDVTASTYRFIRVRSNDVVMSMRAFFGNTDGTNSGQIGNLGSSSLGLYDAPNRGGAGDVVSVGHFVGGLDLGSNGAIDGMELAWDPFLTTSVPTGGQRLGRFGQPVWEQLGLSADPHVQYDVTLTTIGAHAEDSHLAVVALLAAA